MRLPRRFRLWKARWTFLSEQSFLLGDDHPSTLLSMNNLANVYRNQGRYAEAEPLYLETLEAQKRVLGDNHERTHRRTRQTHPLAERSGACGRDR